MMNLKDVVYKMVAQVADLAEECNRMTGRIDRLTKEVRNLYDYNYLEEIDDERNSEV